MRCPHCSKEIEMSSTTFSIYWREHLRKQFGDEFNEAMAELVDEKANATFQLFRQWLGAIQLTWYRGQDHQPKKRKR